MKRYEYKEVTQFQEVLVEYKCDGCGARPVGLAGRLIPVAIEVNYQEEFGSRDEYDYCDGCLVSKAPLFEAAGSTSELVTGNDADSMVEE